MSAAPFDLDYFQLVKQAAKLVPDPAWRKLRLALLADSATQLLVPLLRVLFARERVDAAIYEGDYDAMERESFDGRAGLCAWKPNVVALFHSTGNLKARFYAVSDRTRFVEQRAAEIVQIWDALRSHTTATIVQSTFVMPYERGHGNYGLKLPLSLQCVTQELNRELVRAARERPQVLLNDLDDLASWVGRRSWFDEKLWHLARAMCALDHLPRVARNVVDIALSTAGRGIKCVVVDLDNTIWGGTVGDDGLEGLELGELDDGPAFVGFQHYLQELSRRGILLAVCSKNDHARALHAFREHPDMVLREEDVAVFLANWDDKATNIKRIQETLNIGLDAMVFLDDNPFERNLVRELLPDVTVPELPEDPAYYVKAISELNLFETATHSSLDADRAKLYREQSARNEERQGYADVAAYLGSLATRAVVARFDPFHLPRIAQLIQRSNQFNLTTRRYGQAECEAFMRDEAAAVPIYVHVRDRVGDFGLVLVAILRLDGVVAVVDQFLMSCRVLQRGVEQLAMNHLVGEATARGARQMIGHYVPTAKNGMVETFYAQFGFARTHEDERGTTTWVLELDAYVPRPVPIVVDAADTLFSEGVTHG